MKTRHLILDAEIALEKREELMKLKEKAAGTLVFPSVMKGGFGFGGEYGEGVLFEGEEPTRIYSMISVSVGWQIGLQSRTVALFFMDEGALEDFKVSDGWKIGADLSVAIINADTGFEINTSELTSKVVAIVTDRKGAMVNVAIEGSKITRIDDGIDIFD
jgi:lipid-binding SYLF domain-containing protein